MDKNFFPRPLPGDCDPYFFRYIDLVEADVPVMEWMSRQKSSVAEWINALTRDQLLFQYAPGKWTMAEMIGHMLDTERVFAYRMLSISRNDPNKLPSFEQDGYVIHSAYNDVTAASMAAEWDALRQSSILLCMHMNEEMTTRAGIANSHVTRVSIFPYLMVGHANHHLKVSKELYNIPSPV